METKRGTWLVYGTLVAIWGTILAWQMAEHTRVRKSARAALINRAKDVSDTLGLVMRSQRRFGGVIPKERLESTLHDLVKPGDLTAIALLNAAGEVVASTGPAIDLEPQALHRSGEQWEPHRVTLVNLVDLGTNIVSDSASTNLTIVLPRRERPPTNAEPDAARAPSEMRDRSPRRRDGRQPFGRPPWMSEEEFKNLIVKQGIHGFVLVMSTEPFRAVCRQDLWMRGVISLLGSLSVVAFGLVWRNRGASADLQIRLVRASESNTHLRELNLAAAGLAHETRNPLNIIRGLAQMISKEDKAESDVRKKSRDIINEVDRITVQLNEFMNYSRPREVRLIPVALNAVVSEVLRALSYDIEEKNIRVKNEGEGLVIEADEQLLRQALFNLVINAVQAVPSNGSINIKAYPRNGSAALDISDDGPGVPLEHRTQIFKPYVTMTESGTGLGLAVVQQIVSAHGWEIECLPNLPKGAIFRITHLKLATKR